MNPRNESKISINNYLSQLIRDDKSELTNATDVHEHKGAKFCSDCINDALGQLDITV
ncbi:MAG: hypothetical protein AB2421_03830 [Thermotaleaceae bacterium]